MKWHLSFIKNLLMLNTYLYIYIYMYKTYRWGLKPPSVLDHSDPRSKIPVHFDDSDAQALRSQISELLKPSDPRSKIPDHFDHSDAKALRSQI